MQVQMGADVIGRTGKLGAVHRVIVDARTNTVTDLVVKHGFVFGSERMVPLSYVERVDAEGTVHVTLDEQGFAALEGFTDAHFHAPDPDYSGPTGYHSGLFLVSALPGGSNLGGGLTGKPLGFPGGEETSPDAMARPTIAPGTPILDRDDAAIGEVHELEFEAPGGAPTRLVMRRGHLFHTDIELPISWVQDVSDKGIVLNVPRAEVESLAQQPPRTDAPR